MLANHYLFESAHGTVKCNRVDQNHVTVDLSVYPGFDQGKQITHLQINERDRRALVIIDGDLLPESISRNGICLHSQFLSTISTPVEYLRKARFGEGAYRIVENEEKKEHACIDIERHFLLLPQGNFVFRRVRDLRSFSPQYVMGEVSRNKDGANVVIWRNSTF